MGSWFKKLFGWFVEYITRRNPVDEEPKEEPKEEPAKPSPDGAAPSDFSWTGLVWQGETYAGAKVAPSAPILHSCSIKKGGSMAYFKHDAYSWPSKSVGSALVDAVAVFIWKQSGVWHAAKFDWIRKGGQSAKTLVNIVHEHYNGIPTPKVGDECGFAWVDIHSKNRSAAVFTRWA